MKKEDLQTDQIILDAARRVFQRSGLGGARMQEIADEAGISKASLHYHYRSKEKLFQNVFQQDFQKFMIPLVEILRDPVLSLEQRIRTFVGSYIQTLLNNPSLPLFIMQELSSNPDRLISMAEEKLFGSMEGEEKDPGRMSGMSGEGASGQTVMEKPHFLETFTGQIRDGMERGNLNRVDPEQFILSLISMCVFPFVGRPIVRMVFKKDEQEYEGFLRDREKEILEYLFRVLYKNYEPRGLD